MSDNGNLIEKMLTRDPSLDAYFEIDLSALSPEYPNARLRGKVNIEDFDNQLKARVEGLEADVWLVSACYEIDEATARRMEKENPRMLTALSRRAVAERYAYWDRLKKV